MKRRGDHDDSFVGAEELQPFRPDGDDVAGVLAADIPPEGAHDLPHDGIDFKDAIVRVQNHHPVRQFIHEEFPRRKAELGATGTHDGRERESEPGGQGDRGEIFGQDQRGNHLPTILSE